MMQLLEIPRLTNKLQALIFMRTFNGFISELSASAEILNAGCKEICTNMALRRLLEIVLVVGNKLNRSKARGFRIASVRKLNDTRSTVDPKNTIVHFVAKTVSSTCAELKVPLAGMIAPIAGAESISREWLNSEEQALANDMKLLVDEAARCTGADEKGLRASLLQFAHDAQPQMSTLKEQVGAANDAFCFTAVHFGEDPASAGLKPGEEP